MSTYRIPLDEEDMAALEAGFEALYRAGDPAGALRLGALALTWRNLHRFVEPYEFSVRVPAELRLVRDLEAS